MVRKRKAREIEEEEVPALPLPVPEEQPPLPEEEPPPLEASSPVEAPPLPDEPLPEDEDEDEDEDEEEDENDSDESSLKQSSQGPSTGTEPDAWQAIWEPAAEAYYFYNTVTHETTWLNPRIPESEAKAYLASHPPKIPPAEELPPEEVYDPERGEYAFTARFNAKTGKWQNNPEHTVENFSTEGQIMKTAREYFDVNQMSEGKIVGKSGGALKSERRTMKIPKKQLKELIRRKREKKDRNKREWYRNDDIIVRKH
jgi:WW domain